MIRRMLIALALTICFSGCTQSTPTHCVYQTSTFSALAEGVYDGDTTVGELLTHGDFGIGTFNALDGEMIVLNGEVFQAQATGRVKRVDSATKTPFAAVTYFSPDITFTAEGAIDFATLQKQIDAQLPHANPLYAIRIHGDFDYVKTRAVPAQKQPYPRLVEVVRKQPTFERTKMRGTLVGFRLPEYVKGVNIPGYHVHFISDDRLFAGHVMECRISNPRVEINTNTSLLMSLPTQAASFTKPLTEANTDETREIEGRPTTTSAPTTK